MFSLTSFNLIIALKLVSSKAGEVQGEIVTQDEITRDKKKAKNNHLEANYPGQLIGQDTFYIGC